MGEGENLFGGKQLFTFDKKRKLEANLAMALTWGMLKAFHLTSELLGSFFFLFFFLTFEVI